MSKNTTSKKRVASKEVTVMVQLYRNLSKLFVANDLTACMAILNNGDGRHSLAREFAIAVYGELPQEYEDGWNCYPNTGLEKSNPLLHAVIGKSKLISDNVKLVRTACRDKARGSLTVNKEKRILEDIQDVINELTEFTA